MDRFSQVLFFIDLLTHSDRSVNLKERVRLAWRRSGGATTALYRNPAPCRRVVVKNIEAPHRVFAPIALSLGGPVIRRYKLVRIEDVTGVSGTGIVAYGVVFPDGTVAQRWATGTPSTAIFASIEAVEAIHGHGGATVIEWLDD